MSELRLTSALADLGRVYPWLDEAAAETGVSPCLLARMHVALEEAVANAALHGFPCGATGHIMVRLRTVAEVVELEVEDDGVAFDPTQVPDPVRAASLADVVPGGWGLGLIRRFARSVAYQRRDGSNVLTMRFPIDV